MNSCFVPTLQHLLETAVKVPPLEWGIYYLIKDGVVVYVGQSIRGFSGRVCQHLATEKRGRFDHVSTIPVAGVFDSDHRKLLNDFEASSIVSFSPYLNKSLPPTPLFASTESICEFCSTTKKTLVKRLFLSGVNEAWRTYYRTSDLLDSRISRSFPKLGSDLTAFVKNFRGGRNS